MPTLYPAPSVNGFVEIDCEVLKITSAAELMALAVEVQAKAHPDRREEYADQLLMDEIELGLV